MEQILQFAEARFYYVKVRVHYIELIVHHEEARPYYVKARVHHVELRSPRGGEITPLYTAWVRPIVEYWSVVWKPHFNCHIDALESVQSSFCFLPFAALIGAIL